MLLYLTSSKNRDLIDKAVKEKECTVKKLVGKYVLQKFMVKDIRNYSAIRYFVVDASCTKDSIEQFCMALQSFQMMFPAKIIVVLSGHEKKQDYIDRLRAAGIDSLVTEDKADIAAVQFLETMNDQEPKTNGVWKGKNIRIAIAGAQRRCGTTVTAMNLAFWLSAQGAKVCYAETNINRHLRMILKVCGAKPVENHDTLDGVDFTFSDEFDGDYDFIVYDCGELTVLTDVFQAADKRVLCGSALPYELTAFKRAISLCGELPVQAVAVAVPDEMKTYCSDLLGTKLLFAECSHTLFDENANSELYNEIIREFKK